MMEEVITELEKRIEFLKDEVKHYNRCELEVIAEQHRWMQLGYEYSLDLIREYLDNHNVSLLKEQENE